MEDARVALRDKTAALRQRMLNHQVVNDTAVVVLSARELDELLSFIESYLEQD
jgi:hypothetical protein